MSKVKRENKKIFSQPNEARGALDLGRRIQMVRVALKMNQTEMSQRLKRANNNAVSRLERGENVLIPLDLLWGLIDLAVEAGFTAEWFLTGKAQAATAQIPPIASVQYGVKSVLSSGYRTVSTEDVEGRDWRGEYLPIINRIAAGSGIDTSEAEGFTPGMAARFVAYQGAPKTAVAVQVAGDSMAPTYRDNDLVIVDLARPCDGGICCVIILVGGDRQPRIKRLKKQGKKIILESINPRYPPLELPIERLVASHPIIDHLPLITEGD